MSQGQEEIKSVPVKEVVAPVEPVQQPEAELPSSKVSSQPAQVIPEAEVETKETPIVEQEEAKVEVESKTVEACQADVVEEEPATITKKRTHDEVDQTEADAAVE